LIERAVLLAAEGEKEIEESRLESLQLKFKIHRRYKLPNIKSKQDNELTRQSEGLIPSRKKPVSKRNLSGAMI